MRDGAGEADSLLQQQPFFLRLLQRNSAFISPTASPCSSDHSPGLVPFLWETSPGLPKPYPAPNSQDLASPRLPPPPFLHSPHSFTHRPPLPPASSQPRHSFSSKMKMMLRRQRSSSLSSIDMSAVCAQLESVESSDVLDRKDVVRTMRPSGSISAGLTVGLEENLVDAESPRSYHSNSKCSPRSSQDRTFSSPEKTNDTPVFASSSSSCVSRGLCSVSPSSLMNRHSDSTCSYATVSSHELPGASEVDAETADVNNVQCPQKSASHSNFCNALAKNYSSEIDQQLRRQKRVFTTEDIKYHTIIGGSLISGDSLDENVAELASESAASSELSRSSTSVEDKDLHRRQVSKGRPWEPLNKHRKAYSLDMFSSFDTIQDRYSTPIHGQGASTVLPQVKHKKSPTAKLKVSCLPKMCSTSRCAVSESKSISKGGI